MSWVLQPGRRSSMDTVSGYSVQSVSALSVSRERGRCRFTVWAPLLKQGRRQSCLAGTALDSAGTGSRGGTGRRSGDDLFPGTRYLYRLNDDKDRPDPASRFQPEGVHGPSEVVDPGEFPWDDEAWTGIPLRDFIIYETPYRHLYPRKEPLKPPFPGWTI